MDEKDTILITQEQLKMLQLQAESIKWSQNRIETLEQTLWDEDMISRNLEKSITQTDGIDSDIKKLAINSEFIRDKIRDEECLISTRLNLIQNLLNSIIK